MWVYNQHTDIELTRWSDLNKCLAFVRHIITDCTAVYLHSHQPVTQYYDRWNMYDWGQASIRSNEISHRKQQLSSLRKRISDIMLNELHLSLDEVSDRLNGHYNRITFADFQDIYIDVANKSSLLIHNYERIR